MTLIKIINSEHSAEFGQLITDIKANVLANLILINLNFYSQAL